MADNQNPWLGYPLDNHIIFLISNAEGVLYLLPQKAPNLACFVLYLKIINIFVKNDICIL